MPGVARQNFVRRSNPVDGIVRITGRELADLKRSRLSSCQLMPRDQGGGAVLLEDVAAVEVTVPIEMIMDRGVDGGKFLQGLHVPELRHRRFKLAWTTAGTAPAPWSAS